MLPSALPLRVALADRAWQLDALNRVTAPLLLTKNHCEFSLRGIGHLLHHPYDGVLAYQRCCFPGHSTTVRTVIRAFCIA